MVSLAEALRTDAYRFLVRTQPDDVASVLELPIHIVRSWTFLSAPGRISRNRSLDGRHLSIEGTFLSHGLAQLTHSHARELLLNGPAQEEVSTMVAGMRATGTRVAGMVRTISR